MQGKVKETGSTFALLLLRPLSFDVSLQAPTTACCCTTNMHLQWGVHAGRSWELIEGLDQGQTHIDCPQDGEMALWSHPVDVHYVCRGLLGWPKLHFQIWSQDVHGRNELRE